MKGIILAGGTGSRLDPLTRVTNKHLLPVYNKPMIFYPIQTLVNAGIKDIMIVSGKGHAGAFLELLRSGKEFGANFSYAVQEEAGGIAQALSLCEDFADQDKVLVMLGDNILEDNINQAVKDFENRERGAKIFLKQVDNPKSFGIAQVEGDRIVDIVEKPENPKSDLAVVGLYMYDKQVWDVIKTLKPSGRGELEITDVNNFYVRQQTMSFEILSGWWGDGGESFDSLLKAAELVAKKEKQGESINLTEQISFLENQISMIGQDIQANQFQIEKTNQEIKDLSNQISQAENQITDQKGKINEYLRLINNLRDQ